MGKIIAMIMALIFCHHEEPDLSPPPMERARPTPIIIVHIDNNGNEHEEYMTPESRVYEGFSEPHIDYPATRLGRTYSVRNLALEIDESLDDKED